MEVKNKKIAFFDSGVGGLTVYAKMKELLPNEDYIYFGDLKNSPYGEKSKDELIEISKRIFNFFKKQDVKAVVMACNTTSATAYEPLKDNYDFRIYPIIQSCAKEISDLNSKTICVFATEATVKSHAYKKYINQNNKDINVIEIACPSWVKIVESNKIFDTESEKEIKKYVDKALEFNPDKIVLGCTHYPFLTDVISKFTDKKKILNPAEIFVEYIKNDLAQNSMLKDSPCGQETFYVSDYPDKFRHAGSMFYKLEKSPQKFEI